jgi:hypothetical protein
VTGATALTASMRRKPPPPSLGGLVGAKTPPPSPLRELRATAVIVPCKTSQQQQQKIR